VLSMLRLKKNLSHLNLLLKTFFVVLPTMEWDRYEVKDHRWQSCDFNSCDRKTFLKNHFDQIYCVQYVKIEEEFILSKLAPQNIFFVVLLTMEWDHFDVEEQWWQRRDFDSRERKTFLRIAFIKLQSKLKS
jgi:hypothetical protein